MIDPRIYIVAGIAAAALLAGAGAAHLYYSPRLDLERARVEAMGDKVREQNRAVEALRAAGEQRQAAAAKAVAAATQRARTHEQRAAALKAMQPAGDDCAAIDALLTEGLR